MKKKHVNTMHKLYLYKAKQKHHSAGIVVIITNYTVIVSGDEK